MLFSLSDLLGFSHARQVTHIIFALSAYSSIKLKESVAPSLFKYCRRSLRMWIKRAWDNNTDLERKGAGHHEANRWPLTLSTNRHSLSLFKIRPTLPRVRAAAVHIGKHNDKCCQPLLRCDTPHYTAVPR